MEIKSQSRFVRITPRKARLVVGAVANLSLEKTLATLNKLNKKAAFHITKTIESGISNAENNAKLSRENLYIKELFVDEGPRFKRWRAASRGMARPYSKNTSHITVILDEVKSQKLKSKLVKSDIKSEKKTVKTVKKEEYQTKMKKGMQREMKSQQTRKGEVKRKVIGV